MLCCPPAGSDPSARLNARRQTGFGGRYVFLSLHSLGAVSPSPDQSGGFLWRWNPSSPTTFSPCGFKYLSPDALCVFRREPEGLSEATPISPLTTIARNRGGIHHLASLAPGASEATSSLHDRLQSHAPRARCRVDRSGFWRGQLRGASAPGDALRLDARVAVAHGPW